jgi:two-component system, LuxR family, response regulator FixJ
MHRRRECNGTVRSCRRSGIADVAMTFEHKRPIYIVDDDAAFCRSIERLMRAVGLTAVSFESSSAFLKAASDLVDGCVILDIRMPGMGGLELQRQLNAIGFRMPIIVMTLKGDMETAIRAMKGGAIDFIEKPFNEDKLLDAINHALLHPRVPGPDRESMEAAKRVARLSAREQQVLDQLVAGRLTKQIAYELGISARTVEAHRARMLARLGTRSSAEAVRLAVMAKLAPTYTETSAPGGAAARGLTK